MRMIALILLLSLSLNSYVSKKEMNKKLEFTILNKTIIDNSFINLKIINKTQFNYYLPIINSKESEKWRYILSSNERRFFFIFKVGYNFKNDERHWFTNDCYDDYGSDDEKESQNLNQLWKMKASKINTKDLILLKSNESVIIKVPMNLLIIFSKGCSWKLENYKTEKLTIAINYPKKEKEMASKFLRSQTLDSLKQMGYELYDKEINSNKVPLIIDK